jgi:hypothetical protein
MNAKKDISNNFLKIFLFKWTRSFNERNYGDLSQRDGAHIENGEPAAFKCK